MTRGKIALVIAVCVVVAVCAALRIVSAVSDASRDMVATNNGKAVVALVQQYMRANDGRIPDGTALAFSNAKLRNPYNRQKPVRVLIEPCGVESDASTLVGAFVHYRPLKVWLCTREDSPVPIIVGYEVAVNKNPQKRIFFYRWSVFDAPTQDGWERTGRQG